MKKTIQTLAILFFGLFLFLPKFSFAENVKDFYSEISVLPDSTFVIRENIEYDFGDSLRRGIYRYIPLSKNDKNIHINIISIKDGDGVDYKYSTEYKDGFLNIKIGDPNKIISGLKTYKILYQVVGGIFYEDKFDRLYWNITGDGWRVPILNARAIVNLPASVLPLEADCYYGKLGDKNKCQVSNTNLFTSVRELSPKEGMTIDVKFKKGVVASYQNENQNQFKKYFYVFWVLLIPVLFFFFMFMRWWKLGRDPKGRGVILSEHEIPFDLSPIEASLVLKQKITNESILAEIVSLVTLGYLKIRRVDKSLADFNYKVDYEIMLLKEIGYAEKEHDKLLLKLIFGDKGAVGGVTNISCLRLADVKKIEEIKESAKIPLFEKKLFSYFKENKDKTIALLGFLLLLIFSVFLIPFIDRLIGYNEAGLNVVKIIVRVVAIISSASFVLIFSYLMPAKTKKGAIAKERLLGLKLYIDKAEKSRIRFHSNPKNEVHVFEKLLPYAILFGLETQWMNEFKNVFEKEGLPYRSHLFGEDLISMNDISLISGIFCISPSLSSNICSTSSSSFSTSGGGMGGGGGGSW